jgi:hypothetical protein
MKTFTVTLVATTLATATAFQPPAQSRASTALHEYIPSGFTKDSWASFKAKEKKQKEEQMKKNLGRVGPKGFQSRSFQSFQEALERGETTHMMPVEFAKERLAKGEIKLEDIPVRFAMVDLTPVASGFICSHASFSCLSTCNEEETGTTVTLKEQRKCVGSAPIKNTLPVDSVSLRVSLFLVKVLDWTGLAAVPNLLPML